MLHVQSEKALRLFLKPPFLSAPHCSPNKVKLIHSFPLPLISCPSRCLSVLLCSQVPQPPWRSLTLRHYFTSRCCSAPGLSSLLPLWVHRYLSFKAQPHTLVFSDVTVQNQSTSLQFCSNTLLAPMSPCIFIMKPGLPHLTAKSFRMEIASWGLIS